VLSIQRKGLQGNLANLDSINFFRTNQHTQTGDAIDFLCKQKHQQPKTVDFGLIVIIY
jgi:hypothetical protein